ncbi:MAG: ABC transporter ATP-binding protein [Candidatus Tectomicrobia bacterium]|nr:ABC transporter ATP-binding protein [Candidatus Tectomicrobia bacterium]
MDVTTQPIPPKIAVEKIGKRFHNAAAGTRSTRRKQSGTWALQDINFTVSDGEFVVLVGESGCGKTTLLRLIAGLEPPTTGQVRLNDQVVLQPSQEVGFVFQRPVLLPWRTVLDNVLLPTELTHPLPRRADRQASQPARQQALELLALLDLQPFAGHRPQHLSGGMQQRVALARTLMLHPSVLLMDEPFGALDAITREQLNLELLRMWHHGKQTVIFITHDITEAVFLADRVLLMSRRPGTVAAEFLIPLPRPRTLEMRFESEFASLCRAIHQEMGLMRHDEQA